MLRSKYKREITIDKLTKKKKKKGIGRKGDTRFWYLRFDVKLDVKRLDVHFGSPTDSKRLFARATSTNVGCTHMRAMHAKERTLAPI